MIKRYRSSKIESIFSDENKFQKWFLLESLLLRFLASKNYLSHKEVEDLLRELSFFPKKIFEEEKNTKHDVVAFINVLSNSTSLEAKKWIHFGLTSSDIVDTGNSMMLREANIVLLEKLKGLQKALFNLSRKYKNTSYLQISDGKICGVSSFGYKLSTFYSSISEIMFKFQNLRKYVECVSISGSVGTNCHIDPDFQEFVAKELHLSSTPSSTQVLSRERYYSYFSLLNVVGQVVNNLSIFLRTLSRTEIGEISESFEVKKQIGSSSMPHKKNPITLENICGLSRLLLGYSNSALENISIWLERDISHSSVDRVLFIDAISIADQVITRITKVLHTISVNEKIMKSNIEKSAHIVLAQNVKNLLRQKSTLNTFEVDKFVDSLSLVSQSKGVSFSKLVLESNITSFLDKDLLSQALDLSWGLRHLDILYKKTFGSYLCRSNFTRIYYDRGDIDNAISRLAERINYEYREEKEPVSIVGFEEGSLIFLGKLISKLNFPFELFTFNASEMLEAISKRKGRSYISKLNLKRFKDKKVLVVDELVTTGTTLKTFKSKLSYSDLKVCSLFVQKQFDKSFTIDFYGLPLPWDKTFSGFGIDSAGLFRNLDFVGSVKDEFKYSKFL